MKICPECSNLSSDKAMICGFCGRSLVGIQENSLELSQRDTIEEDDKLEKEETKLANKIYGNIKKNRKNIQAYKGIVGEHDASFLNYKNLFVFLGVIYLILPFIMTPEQFKSLDLNKLLPPVILGVSFFLLAFIKLSNKIKLIIAFIIVSTFSFVTIWSSSIEDIAFLSRNIYIPYDLDARGLSIFFYISILISFISSSFENSIYAFIGVVVSIITMGIVFFYTPHLEFKEMLIFQVYMDYDWVTFLFKISPLLIITYMIFSIGDVYFRIILQYFLILFLSYQYYGYLKGIHYSTIDSIFMAKDFILYIVAIYIVSYFFYKILVVGINPLNFILKKEEIES